MHWIHWCLLLFRALLCCCHEPCSHWGALGKPGVNLGTALRMYSASCYHIMQNYQASEAVTVSLQSSQLQPEVWNTLQGKIVVGRRFSFWVGHFPVGHFPVAIRKGVIKPVKVCHHAIPNWKRDAWQKGKTEFIICQTWRYGWENDVKR